jgi:hypothetical protein
MVAPVDGVVFEEVGQVLDIGDVVDRDVSAARPMRPNPLMATFGISHHFLMGSREFVGAQRVAKDKRQSTQWR